MSVPTKLIAQELELVYKGIKNPKVSLRDLLIESLSRQEKQALDIVEAALEEGTTSDEIAKRLNTTWTNIGNILLRLVTYNLVQRRPAMRGRGYVYYCTFEK